jgi:hypothetical protein
MRCGVDPLGSDAEGEGQLDVSVSVVSMKASTPLRATALIRSAPPSPYATGTTPWLFDHSWLLSLARPMTVAPVRRAKNFDAN